MAQMETAAPAGTRRGGKTQGIFPTTSNALEGRTQHQHGDTPCSGCKHFYGKRPRERGALWSACTICAIRDPGRSCRWFDGIKLWVGSA